MTNALNITVNEYMPLRDVVFHTLRQAILKGELEPGERLMEIRLAKRLGVSRTPIREAIRKLELEGLVIMIPRKGAEVAGITEKNLRDVLEVRRSLEELAIELAVKRMDESGITRLEEARIGFREALNSNDMIRIAQADERFHDAIYAGTDNEKLIQLLNNLRDQMYRYRLEYIKDTGKRQIIMDEHESILNAVKTRDVELGKRAMREHIDNQELTISRKLSGESA
ncbi:GntR family transcriptional regulator [Lachnospiraceae bacterium]|nr:GntR family transcriptional regulator [Lachnospiraceae bacterium]